MKNLSAEETEIEMDKFEAWFVTHRTDWSRDCIYRIPYKNGLGFASGYMQAMWTAWKARAALKPQLTTDTYRQIENDGWIEWGGGRRPSSLSVNCFVEYRSRGGDAGECLAGLLRWTKSGRASDIIAYRVIENNGKEG